MSLQQGQLPSSDSPMGVSKEQAQPMHSLPQLQHFLPPLAFTAGPDTAAALLPAPHL